MPDYPAWPERWEFFDGILKYDPDESEDYGGELDIEGIPHINPTFVVGSAAENPPKRHKPKRKRKRGTKKRKKVPRDS